MVLERLNYNGINYELVDNQSILREFKHKGVNFIITYNIAGKYYGWRANSPTLDLILEDSLGNLVKVMKILNENREWILNLKRDRIKTYKDWFQQEVLNLWLNIGYRDYYDFKYEEYNGYKIINKRDLIDTIKYKRIHIEMRAKLALVDDLFKDKVIDECFFKCIKG